MKTLMITTAAVFLAISVNAQRVKSGDVPAAIKAALEKNYPGQKVTWDKENENYEASFKQKGKEMSIVFDGNGKILETETEISRNELPSAIVEAMKKDYSGYEIEETAKIEANGILTYEVEAELDEKSFDLIFDQQGKLLKKVTKVAVSL